MAGSRSRRALSGVDQRLRAMSLYLRGKAYFEVGLFQQAALDLRASIELSGEFAPAYLTRGLVLARLAESTGNAKDKLQQLGQAIQDFRRASARDPVLKASCNADLAAALAQRGKCLYGEKLYDESVTHLLESFQLDPNLRQEFREPLSDALVYRGINFHNANEFEKAFADYDAAIRARPEAYWAFRNRAMIYRKWKRYDESLKDCDEAIRLNPSFAVAYYQRAWAFIDQDQFETGIAEMSLAIQYKRDAEYLHDRGYCYRRLKQFDSAISDFSEAITIDGKRAWSYINRAYAYRKKGEYDKALRDFNQAIQLNPKESEFVVERGRTLLKLRRIKRGLADLETARALGENCAFTLNLLAWTWATWPHHRVLDGARAVKTARRACKLTSWKTAYILDTLAAAYAQVGRFADAVKWQKQAITLASDADKQNYETRLKAFEGEKVHREIPV
jgi:tetratricopeptide (TPR) repeat protein